MSLKKIINENMDQVNILDITINAADEIPYKKITKEYYAGMFFNREGDFIVFFEEMPVFEAAGKYSRIEEPIVSVFTNKHIRAGIIDLADFQQNYPNVDLSEVLDEDGTPKDTEIIEIFKINLTSYVNEDGEIMMLT